MWSYEHSVRTAASAEALWRLYSDVSTWPLWNAAVEHVRLDGRFAAGTSGKLTPTGQEALPFRLITAIRNTSYTSETDIADTVTLRLTNTLTPLPGGQTRITHRAELDGPAAEFFGRSFGPALTAGIPKSVAALAALALERDGQRPDADGTR